MSRRRASMMPPNRVTLDWVFNGKASAKILRTMLSKSEIEYTISSIANSALVSDKSVRRTLKNLQHIGMVSLDRIEGSEKVYSLSTESDEVKALQAFVAKLESKTVNTISRAPSAAD